MISDTVRQFLHAHGIRGPVLAALSGGPDSTALLLVLIEMENISVTAAHVNHHLRGADSDADEAFVRQLCERLGVTLRVGDGSLDPKLVRQHGVEAAARDIRMARLQEIRSELGASHIATAHQKNDQAETVLMRLMTGGGIAGLRGIHPTRADGVIRPLLEVSRLEVEAYLRQRGVAARDDHSNTDPRFLRNRVRALLSQFEPRVIDNLAAVAKQAREQWGVLERIVDGVDSSTQSPTETRFKNFPDEAWLRQALLHRHIRRLDGGAREVSAADLERLAAELDSLKRVSVTRSLELLRRGDEWILRRKPERVEKFEIELKAGDAVYVPEIRKTISVRPPTTDNQQPTTQTFQLPAGSDAVFIIRNRRQGDRFQPLGMPHEKKLKEFLIDRKIALEARDRIPLLLWRGKIVLVGGVEISEAFKVTGGSGELYEVAIEEKDQEGVQREADRPSDP